MIMPHMPRSALAAALLEWYAAAARKMPWRGQSDPYKIWISEIMLQQTRVEAATGYYLRFIAELPDAAALAAVPEDRLLKLWEGLGYYSRARNLRRAAQVIVEQYGGRLPKTARELLQLPGVGEYTAGAVASIAYGERVPAVDGNVLRVMTRVLGDDGDITRPDTRRRITRTVMREQPADRPGDFNQALMELGALVCLPRQPQCGSCPLAGLCRARAEGRQAMLPVKKAQAPRKIEQRTVLVLCAGGCAALQKRPPRGLLAGLWEFPACAGHVSPEQAMQQARQWGLNPLSAEPLPAYRHIFTHREWDMHGFLVMAEGSGGPFEWVDWDRLRRDMALPSALQGFERAAFQILSREKRSNHP